MALLNMPKDLYTSDIIYGEDEMRMTNQKIITPTSLHVGVAVIGVPLQSISLIHDSSSKF